MKNLVVLAAIALFAQPVFAEIKVIYGADNRQDIYQTRNALHLQLAKSTAGMIHVGMFTKSAAANAFNLQGSVTLERGQNICTSEKFSQQLLAPICSGFLVAPDTIVTAGHCYASQGNPADACRSYAWVFDYDMKSPTHNPTQNIPIQNIYLCKSVSAVKLDGNFDFAVIKLDRKVVGRAPLKFRSSGKLADNTPLMVIGHPSGLPTKISAGARVTNNSGLTRFSTNLDTFHGNSGSAVFNASNGLVEGILIQGKNDYVPSIRSNPRSCMIVNKCDESAQNCLAGVESGAVKDGEVVQRTTQIASIITQAILKK